jgi:hypothetical protein
MYMPSIASMIKIVFQIGWVHYLPRGNTADIDFEDDNSLLGESQGDDKSWLKEMGVLSIIIIFN